MNNNKTILTVTLMIAIAIISSVVLYNVGVTNRLETRLAHEEDLRIRRAQEILLCRQAAHARYLRDWETACMTNSGVSDCSLPHTLSNRLDATLKEEYNRCQK